MVEQSYPDTSGLLPCPFCGEKPFERWEDNTNGPKYPGHWFVWCENLDCKCGGEAMEETQEAARAAWNTRAPQPLVLAQALPDMRSALSLLTSLDRIAEDFREVEPCRHNNDNIIHAYPVDTHRHFW